MLGRREVDVGGGQWWIVAMCVGTGDCWVAVGLAASRAAGHRETHFSTQKYSL